MGNHLQRLAKPEAGAQAPAEDRYARVAQCFRERRFQLLGDAPVTTSPIVEEVRRVLAARAKQAALEGLR